MDFCNLLTAWRHTVYINLYLLHSLNLGHLLDAMSNFCHQMAALTKARPSQTPWPQKQAEFCPSNPVDTDICY